MDDTKSTLTCHVGNISKEVTVDPCINNGSLMKWESIDIPCKLEKECENMKCSFAFKGKIEIKKIKNLKGLSLLLVFKIFQHF